MRGRAAHVGDRLRITAVAVAGENVAVRVFRDDGEPLLDCPRQCQLEDGAWTGEVVLGARGSYQIVWLRSRAPLPPPARTPSDEVTRAAQAGARYELREIAVR
jgi:hypothetical protein